MLSLTGLVRGLSSDMQHHLEDSFAGALGVLVDDPHELLLHVLRRFVVTCLLPPEIRQTPSRISRNNPQGCSIVEFPPAALPPGQHEVNAHLAREVRGRSHYTGRPELIIDTEMNQHQSR